MALSLEALEPRRVADGAIRLSRGLRLIPIVLLLWIVLGLAWRLVRPPTPEIPSRMVNFPVPAFDLAPALPGKPGLRTADFAGGGPHLLNVFASWCVPCIGEAPVLSELRTRGAKIDAIAVRDTPDAVTIFLAHNGDPYERLGADPQSNVQMSLGSSGVPETFVVDGHGVIRRQYIGPLGKSDVPGVLRELEQVR
jgi:cytochrome c biogenesis protein CcmG/thiol:disulfide interchange protein DsbE